MSEYRLTPIGEGESSTALTLDVPPGAILVVEFPEGYTPMPYERERMHSFFAEHLPGRPVLFVPHGIRFLRLEATE